jgi:hypothetical protein
MHRDGQNFPYIYIVYDRIFGSFPAKNTVYTLCIYMVLAESTNATCITAAQYSVHCTIPSASTPQVSKRILTSTNKKATVLLAPSAGPHSSLAQVFCFTKALLQSETNASTLAYSVLYNSISKVGQSRKSAPCMTVCMVISLLKTVCTPYYL